MEVAEQQYGIAARGASKAEAGVRYRVAEELGGVLMLRGRYDEAGEHWASRTLHTFKHDGYEPTWQQLLEWRVGLRRGCRAAADRLLNYVSERQEMIKYPEFSAKGWQIGSGPTEATCKTLTARLKGSGMRWDADNAEAIMALEALTQSGQWDLYWQSRLFPTG